MFLSPLLAFIFVCIFSFQLSVHLLNLYLLNTFLFLLCWDYRHLDLLFYLAIIFRYISISVPALITQCFKTCIFSPSPGSTSKAGGVRFPDDDEPPGSPTRRDDQSNSSTLIAILEKDSSYLVKVCPRVGVCVCVCVCVHGTKGAVSWLVIYMHSFAYELVVLHPMTGQWCHQNDQGSSGNAHSQGLKLAPATG